MYHHSRTPLRVPIVAIFITLFAMFLFGGASYATDEAQSSPGITAEVQSVNTTAQSSGAVTTTAATNNEDQSSSGGSVATAATANDKPTSCIPRDISPGEVDTLLQTQDGSAEYTAYEAVQFSISLTLEEGHCAGDSVVVTVPSELGTDTNFTPIPMETPDGVIIGYATYSSDHTVVIKLTSEVEVSGRKDFRASAWWRVHMSSTMVPGETRELRWDIDGVVRRTTIQVGVCDGCSTIGAEPSKWGSADNSKQHVTLVLPTAEHDGQTFTVTDTLTSPGQSFDCNQLLTGQIGIYSKAGPWGQPQYTRYADPDVVSCTNDKVGIKVQLNTGEKARFEMNINISATDPGPWTDVANITSQDLSWDVSARIIRREAGGNAGFDTNPTPTPTPAPSPAPTPTPVPTPSASPSPTPTPSPSTSTPVTPTPAPSASPSPSPSAPSPSVTPTPTPSASPSPTPTPSTTPSATSSTTPAPVPTPSATPTPAPQHKLAVTGADGDAIALAIVFLTVGGVVLWMRRRQTAHSED